MEPGFFDNYLILLRFARLTWWLWLPPVLLYSAWQLWTAYLNIWYWKGLEWVLLEIKIPREIAKPPQAMEQIFAGLHAMVRPLDPDEKYWYGLQEDYIVFELVGHGGQIHFLVYTPKKFRNLVEAQVYAQYPESEIREADDPASYLPNDIPNKDWTLFAAEWKLEKESAYPIRTYHEFVLEKVAEEEEKVDPVSAIAETLARLKPDEHIGIQLMIRPIIEPHWKDEGEKIVRTLIGKKIPKSVSAWERIAGELSEVIVGPPSTEKKPAEDKSLESHMLHLSPGEREVVTGIERKIAKLGYDSVLRFVYVAKRDIFDMVHFASMMGSIRQFNTQNLNSLKLNSRALVGAKWYSFIKSRTKDKKRKAFWYYYRSRQPFSGISLMNSKSMVLNIEELASIYHFPGRVAAAPLMPRLQARRAEPPPGLPVG